MSGAGSSASFGARAAYALQLGLASLSGYLLTRLVAYLYGTSESAAAFEIAWSIPMFLITASGFNVIQAVSARFFAARQDCSTEELSDYVFSFLGIFGLIVIPLVVVVWWCAEPIAGWAAQGLAADSIELTAILIRILVPVSALLGFGLFFGGVYAAFGKPVTAELSLLLTRGLAVLIVAGGLIAGWQASPIGLGWTLLGCAVFATLVAYAIARRSLGVSLRRPGRRWREIASEVGLQTLVFLIGSLVGQGTMILYRSELGLSDPGYVAAFSYAVLITYTFSNIVGKLGFFSGARPSQSLFERGQYREYLKSVGGSALRYLVLSSAVAVTLYVFGEWFIAVLLSGGAFGRESGALVGEFFGVLALSVPATTLIWVLKLPAITGPMRFALPVVDLVAWVSVVLLVTLPGVALGAREMVLVLVASYWFRALAAAVLVLLQVMRARQRDGAAD